MLRRLASTRVVTRAAALAALVLPLAACDHDGGRAADTFTWADRVPAGGWLRVRNLNGTIRVARATGPEVRVSATKRYRGRRPETVRFVANRDGGDAVVCALWGGSGGRCDADGYGGGGRRSWLQRIFRRGSVSVDFVVALPPGVRLDASTVNGRVTVADAAGEVRARTVNGSVTVDARGGPISAETVNGSVLARVDALRPGAGLALETVNGSVTVLLPPAIDADLDAQTVNGSVRADFPVTLDRVDRRHLQGTLGRGGHRLSVKTVNGSVRLQRSSADTASVAGGD